ELSGIGPFFASFCAWALFLRGIARSWSRQVGRHKLILLGWAGAAVRSRTRSLRGVAGQALGMSTLPLVTRSWPFVFPAIGYAFGHALLFPSVVSLGAGAFPAEYRGSGTTIVLGFTEVGAMISAQPLGWIIVRFSFPAMFLTVAGLGVVVGLV